MPHRTVKHGRHSREVVAVGGVRDRMLRDAEQARRAEKQEHEEAEHKEG